MTGPGNRGTISAATAERGPAGSAAPNRDDRRLRILANAGATLAGSLDLRETLERAVRLPLPDLADFATLYLLDDDDRLQPAALAHVDPRQELDLRAHAERHRPELDHPSSPASDATRTGASVLVELTPEAIADIVADAEARRLALALGGRRALVVALAGRERVLGALSLVRIAERPAYDAEEVEIAEELGRRAGMAIENARLHGELERARDEQRFLLEASEVLASTLDYRTELEQIARLAVPTLADWCAVDLVEADGLIHRLASVHRDPAKGALLAELQHRYPVLRLDQPHTITRVLSTGKPWFDPDVHEERFTREARDQDHLALLRELGFAAEIVVPLRARGRALGALTLVLAGRERRYGRRDVELAEELARRCALAIDNARLYEAERSALSAARGAEARYRGLFEGLLDAAVVADEAGRYLDANPAALELLGYSREELVRLRMGDLAADPAVAADSLRAFARTGSWRGEVVLRRKDGAEFDAEISVRRTELGRESVRIATMRDITARKAAEADAHFLADLADRTLRNEDPTALLTDVLAAVRDHLRVEHCFFIEVDAGRERGATLREAPASSGARAEEFALTDYGPAVRAALAGGRTVAVADTAADPRTAAAFPVSYGPSGERGYVGVPLHRDGVWRAVLSVTMPEPRSWQAREIALLETVAERTWHAVERLRLNQALRDAEARLSLAQSAAGIGVWDWSADAGVAFWSDTMHEIYGLPPRAGSIPATGAWAAMIHPDDQERVAAATERAMAHGASFRDEFRIVRPDGSQRWVESIARIERDGDGRAARMYGINRDVTDRRRMVERLAFLADVGARLAASLDLDEAPETVARLAVPAFADYVFVDLVHPDGSILRAGWAHADPEWQERFDRDAGTWMLPSPLPATHPIARAVASGVSVLVTNADDPAWQERVAFSPEHARFMREVGLRSVVTVPMVARGQTIGAMTACTTTASLRRFTEDDQAAGMSLAARAALAIDNARLLRGAREELQRRQRAEEERRTFVDAVAHDVKGPLSAIKAETQLMQRRLRRAATADEGLLAGLERIAAAGERAVALVDEMLDAARLQAGERLELRPEPVDLVALVSARTAHAARTSPSHRIEMLARVAELTGTWDRVRLERVLDNLLQNAIKYSPGGELVTVEVERSAGHQGGLAVVRVVDRGIGVPAADLPHVFERFHRGSNVSGRYAGTGLGLSGARQIVEQHGGRLVAESVEGEGSRFTMELPI